MLKKLESLLEQLGLIITIPSHKTFLLRIRKIELNLLKIWSRKLPLFSTKYFSVMNHIFFQTSVQPIELDYGLTSNRNSRTVILRGIISTNTVGLLFMYKRIIDGKKYLKMLEDHLLQSFSQLKGTRTIKGS